MWVTEEMPSELLIQYRFLVEVSGLEPPASTLRT